MSYPYQVNDTEMRALCKIGMGAECCRYLVGGADGLSCAKHTELKAVIDARVANGQFKARGDNCEGKLS